MLAQRPSSSSTAGLENTSPEGSRRTIGSRVQERRQSRVTQEMRPARDASGKALEMALRSSVSRTRPRPSASQRGPTQTSSRQAPPSGEGSHATVNARTPDSCRDRPSFARSHPLAAPDAFRNLAIARSSPPVDPRGAAFNLRAGSANIPQRGLAVIPRKSNKTEPRPIGNPKEL